MVANIAYYEGIVQSYCFQNEWQKVINIQIIKLAKDLFVYLQIFFSSLSLPDLNQNTFRNWKLSY